MPIMLGVTVRIERKSNVLNIGVYFMAMSNSKYHVYAAKLS